jgi:hypothetical protein
MLSTEERTWQNAPQSVRSVRSLVILAVVLYGVFFLLGLATLHDGGAFAVGMVVFFGLLIAFQLWMLKGLRQGIKFCYYFQMVISILGLSGFPLGTLLHGYVLYLWFQPETKAWFGV